MYFLLLIDENIWIDLKEKMRLFLGKSMLTDMKDLSYDIVGQTYWGESV